jgi:hypothetical protein
MKKGKRRERGGEQNYKLGGGTKQRKKERKRKKEKKGKGHTSCQ